MTRCSSTRCAGENSVAPEVYFKAMPVVQMLKLPTVGRRQRPALAESPVKAAAVQRDGDGEVLDDERQTRLPAIQTTTTDVEEGTRSNVVHRWRRAVAAALGTTESNSMRLTPGETPDRFAVLTKWVPTTAVKLKQVAQLSQRDRAAGWVSCGQK